LGAATFVDGKNLRTVAGSPTLDETFGSVLINAAAAPRTVTLPLAATARNRIYTIKKIDASANTVTIDPAGGETIDGFALQLLTAQWQSLTIQSDGTGWFII
jgi:hypothetical protein